MNRFLALTTLTAACNFPQGQSGPDNPSAKDAAIVDPDDAGDEVDGPASASFDPNGVQQIYPTRAGKAEPWTLGFDDWNDRTRSFGTIADTGANTVVTASGQVRMSVMSVQSSCEGNTDQGEALQQGYMCSPNDWYAFEMTAYVQLVSPATAEDDRDWTWYGGGGRHTGDGPPTGCMGSAYKGSYHYANAEVRVRKESYHVNYSNRNWKPVPGGIDFTADRTKWLGMKLIRYEITRDNMRGMRLEQWLDLGGIDADGKPANQWVRVNVEEDHPSAPSFGTGARGCGAPVDDQILLWGGPWVTFRWDGTTSKTRLMSVREIVAPLTPPP